jgi:hypothetical protein
MLVMAGLVPAIHVLFRPRDMDARDKPGHDEASRYFFTLLASILTLVSSILVENAVFTSNGFSMPR